MWTGECNRCGLCCGVVLKTGDGQRRRFNCGALEVTAPLGTPGATRCRMYATKYTGMVIALWSDAVDLGRANCLPEYPRPQDAVPPECSYVWAGDPDKKPVWTSDFVPVLMLK